jgi:hypothetical protein
MAEDSRAVLERLREELREAGYGMLVQENLIATEAEGHDAQEALDDLIERLQSVARTCVRPPWTATSPYRVRSNWCSPSLIRAPDVHPSCPRLGANRSGSSEQAAARRRLARRSARAPAISAALAKRTTHPDRRRPPGRRQTARVGPTSVREAHGLIVSRPTRSHLHLVDPRSRHVLD